MPDVAESKDVLPMLPIILTWSTAMTALCAFFLRYFFKKLTESETKFNAFESSYGGTLERLKAADNANKKAIKHLRELLEVAGVLKATSGGGDDDDAD